MVEELSYNLPGYGFANCYLIGQAIDLMNILENNGMLEKMQNTCQLGTMRYVYPGAHHTRYEYVFTQLMLISNIATSDIRRNVELSISSNLSEFEQLGYNVSGSTLMQCLAILSNAGHMYDTFTASRIVLRLLNESKKKKTYFYKIYKRNLPNDVRKMFDKVLADGNYYKLHLFHVIHIIQGLNRSKNNKEICDLCVYIVSKLIDPELINSESTKRIFFLYKKIRKIAYLSVDMVYTPASFGANLSRMMYSIASYVDDLFDENSAMNKSIEQLEDIIHQQIYDSPMCILNTTRIEQECYLDYKRVTEKIEDVFELRNFLLEKGKYEKLHSIVQPKSIRCLDKGTTLLLSQEWNVSEAYDLSYESQIVNKLPIRRVAYGTQIAQNFKRLYSAYGLISLESVQKDVRSIISNVISLDTYSNSCKIEIVKYAIKSIYEYGKFFFNLTMPIGFTPTDGVFIGKGCKKIACEIRSKFTSENIKNADQLHEIISCASVLEKINYSGTVICFVGGIKANKYEKTGNVDEIDGFIYLPNVSDNKSFAYIIEAKNYKNGEKDAEKQLKATLKFIDNGLNHNIVKMSRCAYMEIS